MFSPTYYYFVLGDIDIPVLYHVDPVRDGKTFYTRCVKAVQDGQTIFTCQLSFQKVRRHQIVLYCSLIVPFTVLSFYILTGSYTNQLRK